MEKYSIFLFGIVFMIALLYAGLRKRPITDPGQFFFLRVIASVSGAGIAAMIPGLIELQFSTKMGISISAGGALAVFIIIYYINPPKVINNKIKLEEQGEFATDLNIPIISALKRKDYKEAEEFALKYLEKYPHSLRAKYNLVIAISMQQDNKLNYAYKLFDSIINSELFEFLQRYEAISNPVDFVLNDPNLSVLYDKFPDLRTRIKAYEYQFTPIMGTELYGYGCFPKGSLVMVTCNSYIEIEKLKIGDNVLGRDEENENITNTVVGSGLKRSRTILINNKIRVSVTQPLKKADGTWCEASKLLIGDILLHYNDSKFLINSLTLENDIIDVYWIEVIPNHCYWVESLLAHNKLLDG